MDYASKIKMYSKFDFYNRRKKEVLDSMQLQFAYLSDCKIADFEDGYYDDKTKGYMIGFSGKGYLIYDKEIKDLEIKIMKKRNYHYEDEILVLHQAVLLVIINKIKDTDKYKEILGKFLNRAKHKLQESGIAFKYELEDLIKAKGVAFDINVLGNEIFIDVEDIILFELKFPEIINSIQIFNSNHS
ncbi:hypothetical protein [Aneurinibacillus tyrosinisolvens]|uniref:hypothetical protein n=1 Tax=Aneurinibacillus tyrosinisolvens TaxID=1443435 RepID=UPI00063F0FB8|nr:hypothetical protein [Aneurinibacillus tyrosinisolvens]